MMLERVHGLETHDRGVGLLVLGSADPRAFWIDATHPAPFSTVIPGSRQPRISRIILVGPDVPMLPHLVDNVGRGMSTLR